MEDGVLARALQMAGTPEMADRCHTDTWDEDLDRSLARVPLCPTCEPVDTDAE